MKAKQFEGQLAKLLAVTPSEVDQRVRPLREAGELPSVRGRHAPEIEPALAAMMLLAMVPRRAGDSLTVMRRASALRCVNGDEIDTQLATRLAHLLCEPEESWMKRLMVAGDGSAAWMLTAKPGKPLAEWLWVDHNKREEFRTSGADPAKFGSTYLGWRFVMGGPALQMLGQFLKFAPPTVTATWGAPAPADAKQHRTPVEV
ncbi:hypothetical protein [Methylobacterium sp. WSM2598]|uniref:hypothetical protein n=1 Tax=Methylobacterium sp. WSM2598 TaxID=398261 RepID=UPI00035C80DF|nr:hypothetical protein [Methylobacterium sp. WSM2598]